MSASLAASTPAFVAPRARTAPAAGRPGRRPAEAVPAALAFGLLCLWIGSTPRTVAGLLAADGFDPDFGG